MRLIDADTLKRQLSTAIIMFGADDAFADGICKIIDKQLTSYDVDKVVSSLKKSEKVCAEKAEEHEAKGRKRSADIYAYCADSYAKAIEIVKSGGIE